MRFGVTVSLPAPIDEVYALLADPTRRSEWQASLRRVEPVDPGPPRVGQRWYDVTAVGVRPLMELTELDPLRSWGETGTWRGVRVELRLGFTPSASSSTLVHGAVTASAPGLRRPVGWMLRLLGPAVVRHDLRTAGELLARNS